MDKVFIAPGLRIPFAKAGRNYSQIESIGLSTPVITAMTERARPDFVVWGQVIPDTTISNLGRELVLEAGLDPEIPAFSTQFACGTSALAAIQAASMIGKGGARLAIAGGAESMSHIPIALKAPVARKLMAAFAGDPADALRLFNALTPDDFNLPVNSWANRISGRSMGDHTEDTAKLFEITRAQQDEIALASHEKSVAAWESGFFSDLVIPFGGLSRDGMPRPDTTLEKLGALHTVFDASAAGSITAGNASPLTDGAAGVWIANEEGLTALGTDNAVELVDWQLAAMDYRVEGILMAPARALPRLLARRNLRLDDIAFFEIHEAFAAQVAANIKAFCDPAYRKAKAGVEFDLGEFPWDRLNPHGGSIAIGHPFGATGARILSQTAKHLATFPSKSFAILSLCADGGQGVVILLRKL